VLVKKVWIEGIGSTAGLAEENDRAELLQEL